MSSKADADDIREQIAAVRHDLDALTVKLGQVASSETDSLVAELRSQVDALVARGGAAANSAGEKVSQVAARLEGTVERNPLAAVAIALAAGCVLGYLSRRK